MIMTSPVAVDHSRISSRRRFKFSGCFKPSFADARDDDDDEPCCNSKSSPPPPPPSYSGDESGGSRKKSRSSSYHRGFAAAVKAVFFKTSLAKKPHSVKQVDHQSSSNSSSKNRKLVKKWSMKRSLTEKFFSDRKEISRSNSDSSSLISSSSSSITSTTSSSASSYCSRSGPERIKRSTSFDLQQITNPVINYRQASRKRDDVDAGSKCMCLCVLLVCLVSLVFWGKVFAIATCTTTWLFFAPGRRLWGFDSPGNEMFDSVEYKKRVIMDGLLERSRTRVL